MQHEQLFTATGQTPDQMLHELQTLLQNYERLWQTFSKLYFAVKTADYIDDARMCLIEETHPLFCVMFEEIISLGKEPPPIFHVIFMHAHLVHFIKQTDVAGLFPRKASNPAITSCAFYLNKMLVAQEWKPRTKGQCLPFVL